jgi:hypothetical protein
MAGDTTGTQESREAIGNPNSSELPFVDKPRPPKYQLLGLPLQPFARRSNVNGSVADMHPGPLHSFITRAIIRRLVRSAYPESELRSFISEAGFQSASIREHGFGFGTWLHKAA